MRWHQAKKCATGFRTPLMAKPGTQSSSLSPGQLWAHPSVPYIMAHPPSLSWMLPPLFPECGMLRITDWILQGKSNCFLQAPPTTATFCSDTRNTSALPITWEPGCRFQQRPHLPSRDRRFMARPQQRRLGAQAGSPRQCSAPGRATSGEFPATSWEFPATSPGRPEIQLYEQMQATSVAENINAAQEVWVPLWLLHQQARPWPKA